MGVWATAMPVPDDEPEALRSRSHGFWGIGNGLLASGWPIANSLSTSLPVIAAPAARSFETTVAS